MRRTWLWIFGLLIVGVLVMVYVLPQGVKSDSPQADITVYIQDLGTNELASAQVTVGEPKSALSFVGDSSPFMPLESWEGSQSVNVYLNHRYALWASVSFKYTGDKIKSYSSAYVDFLGSTSSGGLLLSQNQWDGHYNDVVDASNAKFRVTANTTSSPMTVSMNQGNGWIYTLISQSKPSSYGTPWYITGGVLDITTINVWVTVKGVAQDDSVITATVDGKLNINADFQAEGGTISISVDSMSAGVS